jgi:hypothetical protein
MTKEEIVSAIYDWRKAGGILLLEGKEKEVKIVDPESHVNPGKVNAIRKILNSNLESVKQFLLLEGNVRRRRFTKSIVEKIAKLYSCIKELRACINDIEILAILFVLVDIGREVLNINSGKPDVMFRNLYYMRDIKTFSDFLDNLIFSPDGLEDCIAESAAQKWIKQKE